jgi:DNA-binding IclR family transcriptional regulator
MAEGEVKSARRVFEILEAFDRGRRPLSLKELLDELGYPTSSGSALLKSLVNLGYLDYDRRQRTYFPTMRVAALGAWVGEALFGDGPLLAAMEALHQRCGETMILGIQSDLHVQYVHVIHSDEVLQFRAPPGTRRPLARSGMGWALLAVKRDAEIEDLRRRINARSPDKVSREELVANVHETRRRGYAVSRGVVTEGAGMIAAAVWRPMQRRWFALGAAGYLPRLERKEGEIAEALRDAAANLSKDVAVELDA